MEGELNGLPVLPHLSSEFYLWLWWRSEETGGAFSLDEPVGAVHAWMDERLAFRNPGESKVSAVLTGDRAAEALEARAALYGGKVVQEVALKIRRDEREFSVTLKGPAMNMTQMKLPQALRDAEDEVLFDRMFLYDELCLILAGLFGQFATERITSKWNDEIVPGLRNWVQGE